VLICGYHGWHDTFAQNVDGSTTPGVLDATAAFTHRVAYGDIAAAEALGERFGGDLAALMTVPYEFGSPPRPDFLQALRTLADHLHISLIFDEVLTGFRLSLGGGQEYFGVTPDLASFAKAIANGYPLSVFAGRREYMENLSEALITTTYAGEALSLAAARATLGVLCAEPVHAHIWQMGQRLAAGFDEAIRDAGLPARSVGLAAAPVVHFETGEAKQDAEMEIAFHREMYRRGVFAVEPWLLSYAHSVEDIDRTVEAARAAFHVVAQMLG
jgi:glutamate-1-semialdehyde aminotransferase